MKRKASEEINFSASTPSPHSQIDLVKLKVSSKKAKVDHSITDLQERQRRNKFVSTFEESSSTGTRAGDAAQTHVKFSAWLIYCFYGSTFSRQGQIENFQIKYLIER